MIAEREKGSIVSFRNDRMGARLMTLMNTIRISQDYDIPYSFVWKTDGRTSAELLHPTEIFDASYFEEHEVTIDHYREVAPVGTDLGLLPTDSTPDDLRSKIDAGTSLICTGSDLMVLPWETAEDVAPRYAAAIHTLKFSPEVNAAIASVNDVLSDGGTAFHIRRGDIIYDPVTSNNLWSNKYVPREFYEVLAKRLVETSSARILVFSDEPAEIERLKELSPQILGASDVVPKDLTLAQRDFIELYAMSRCDAIHGPAGSGFSMTAALMGNIKVADVRDALSKDEHDAALDLLVSRLVSEPERFLSDGDIGQCFPFAVNFLNAADRGYEALDLLQIYNRRGFSKHYFFSLLMRQNLLASQFVRPGEVMMSFASADIDASIPGRVEQNWSEMFRLAAISSAHLGDKDQVRCHITRSIWISATYRPAVMTLSQLCSWDFVDGDDFPIPFDTAVHRLVPPKAMEAMIARDGHINLFPPASKPGHWVMPNDLIAYDWSLFLGKAIGRGFAQPDMIRRSAELFKQQFARQLPEDVVAGVLGLYAQQLGETDKALDLYELALSENGDNPLVLKRNATLRLANDPTDALGLKMLEKAAEIGGPVSLYAAQLGHQLWANGDRPRALEIMKNASELALVPEIAFMTARMMRQSKQSGAEALAYMDQAIETVPDVRRFLGLRAQILLDMKEVESAGQAIETISARFVEGGDLEALRKRLTELRSARATQTGLAIR